MAIARDATTSGGSGVTSWSHTCAAGAVLLVWVTDRQSAVSGVTYNGVAMTQKATKADLGGGGTLYLYYLANPASGSHTVAVSGTSGNMAGISVSYLGANGNQFDSLNTGAANTSPLTVATTVVKSNCWLVGSGYSFSASGNAESSNKTDLANVLFFSNGYAMVASDTNGTVSTGSQSIAFSNATGTPTQAAIVASLAPVLSAGLSVTVSNAASRLATVATLRTKVKTLTSSVSNAASRFVSVASLRIVRKSLSLSVSNAASRLSTIFPRISFHIDARNVTTLIQDSRTGVGTFSQDSRSSQTFNPDHRNT